MPSLMVRTKMIFNEIVAIDARLKELGIAAESVLEEAKKMYEEHGEDTARAPQSWGFRPYAFLG